jgi:hypothetical protein
MEMIFAPNSVKAAYVPILNSPYQKGRYEAKKNMCGIILLFLSEKGGEEKEERRKLMQMNRPITIK